MTKTLLNKLVDSLSLKFLKLELGNFNDKTMALD